MDVVSLYSNIPHGGCLTSLEKFLVTRHSKQISSDTFAELAEVVLKNNITGFDEKTFKQKWNSNSNKDPTTFWFSFHCEF